MPIHKKTAFSRRLPDLVTEELAAVLSSRTTLRVQRTFRSRARESARRATRPAGVRKCCGLRAYEKLQNLVARGMVKKDGKKYKGIPKQLATLRRLCPAPSRCACERPCAGAHRTGSRVSGTSICTPRSHERISADPPAGHRRDRLCRVRADHQRHPRQGRQAQRGEGFRLRVRDARRRARPSRASA